VEIKTAVVGEHYEFPVEDQLAEGRDAASSGNRLAMSRPFRDSSRISTTKSGKGRR
jgi:hypothetical protein